jgi:hypothetical protein
MASSSSTPSQPIKRPGATSEHGSAAASPSSRGMGIASPPVPNIPPRNTDSPFGTSFRPKSFAGSFAERDFSASYAKRKGLDSAGNQGNKDRSSSSANKDLHLGEKRDTGSSVGAKVSALTAGLDEGKQDGSKASNSKRDESPDKSDQSGNEDGSSKKKPDLTIPNMPRQFSSNSMRKDPPTPGDSGISTPGHVVTPTQIEEIPEEEKLRILRRHLVSAEERFHGDTRRGSVIDGDIRPSVTESKSRKSSKTGGVLPDFRNDSNLTVPSDSAVVTEEDAGTSAITKNTNGGKSSRKGSMRLVEEESQDVFPMPYDALGGDVT